VSIDEDNDNGTASCLEPGDPFSQRIAELERTIRALCAARPQIIAFALAMEERLKAHDERGRRGWHGMPSSYLLQLLRQETYALQEQCDVLELEAQIADPAAVLDRAANLANFAMFLADNAGALKP
jgi:hypothetical protein